MSEGIGGDTRSRIGGTRIVLDVRVMSYVRSKILIHERPEANTEIG